MRVPSGRISKSRDILPFFNIPAVGISINVLNSYSASVPAEPCPNIGGNAEDIIITNNRETKHIFLTYPFLLHCKNISEGFNEYLDESNSFTIPFCVNTISKLFLL